MHTLGIKAIQTNPALLTQTFEAGEFALITKHGTPIGLALGFDDRILSEGLKHWLIAKAYGNGDMSLAEVARAWQVDREEALQTLGALGIASADYSLADDVATLDRLGL